jgi:enoyl-CoA hydratase/carnithine racemase
LLLVSTKNNVTTMVMNNPKKLNGWTLSMMTELFGTFDEISQDGSTKVAILSGAGNYYCAGVNLAETIKPMHPQKLWEMIDEKNRALFDVFLNFPKPIIAAVNGPAIGASVTSATLCDAIIASPNASFNTPFSKLGVPPEGCSSVHFERIMGLENKERMIGAEGWVPTAAEALEIGMIQEVVDDHEQLLSRAQVSQRVNVNKKRLQDIFAGTG